MRRLLVLLCLLAVAGCGGDEVPSGGPSPAPTAAATTAPEPAPAAEGSAANAFIGSIAVDPAGGTVFLGTGLGLFVVRDGEAEKVTGTLEGEGAISSNLVVRFAGPGELLASGHPDGGGLPENLGLVRSTDGGRTWQPVSALGEDDYHVLQVTGDRVVAVRAEEADVLVSADGGRTFESRTPPAPPVDVAFQGDRLAVSTADGLFTSDDGGRSWRPRDPVVDAQLAWGAEELYRVDPGGAVWASADGGATWQQRGSTEITPSELAVDADGALYAGVPGGEVLRSRDGGRSWKRFVKLR